MGVLACDRTGCQNVMCDKYIQGMYICWECLDEFEESVGDEDRSEKEFIALFTKFMDSDKNLGSNKVVSLNQFLESK